MKESSLQKEKRNEGRHYRNCAKHQNEMSCLCLVTRVTFCKRQYTAKKWHSTFGFSGGFSGPNIAVTGERISRVCCRRKKTRKKEQNGKIIYIGNSLKNSSITPTGEKTPEHALQKKNEAEDDRRHLLSTVAKDYSYLVLQEVFHCSSKTVTTA